MNKIAETIGILNVNWEDVRFRKKTTSPSTTTTVPILLTRTRVMQGLPQICFFLGYNERISLLPVGYVIGPVFQLGIQKRGFPI